MYFSFNQENNQGNNSILSFCWQYIHSPKRNPNFRESRGKRDTTRNIPCINSFSPLHSMLYFGQSITFGTVKRKQFHRYSLPIEKIRQYPPCSLHGNSDRNSPPPPQLDQTFQENQGSWFVWASNHQVYFPIAF